MSFKKSKFILFVMFFLSLRKEEHSLGDFSLSLSRGNIVCVFPYFHYRNSQQRNLTGGSTVRIFIDAIQSAKQVTRALKEGHPLLPLPHQVSVRVCGLSNSWFGTDQYSAVSSYCSQLGFSFAPPSTTKCEH